MKCNVGKTDRVVRIVVGLVLISLVFVGPKTPWGWIGAVLVLTGLFKFCPAYLLMKCNTAGGKEECAPKA